jgi:ParB family chromosome partitioning protein
MAKSFDRRVTKKKREKIDLSSKIDSSLFSLNDEKLLRGAQLQNVKLKDIHLRAQVRTKFNDDSIKELAANIKENGLIQPLVIHREGSKFVLICGERRFRAMSTLAEMFEAPCFILENKTKEELMAIQFSENSSREDLHYIDQADSIWGYKQMTGASERKIQSSLGVSKSEVHRCLHIAKMPAEIKEAAKMHNIEKYVLLEWEKIDNAKKRKEIKEKILTGKITKRSQLRVFVKNTTTKKVKAKTVKTDVSAELLAKMGLDQSKMNKESKKALEEILNKISG